MAAEEATQLTIDELAQRTGMTARNIRAHQSRGLLPPPEVRARTGYYGPEHVARLKLIQEMQASGFNLKSIERLLDASDGKSEQILTFGKAVLDAFVEEEPEFATGDELAARFGGGLDDKLARKAEKLGLIRALGDGRFEIPSPTLMRAGEELISMGIPASHVIAVGERIDRHTRSIAESFVRLFMEDVVGSRDTHELSGEEWGQLGDALERLRPLASEAVRAAFQQAMSQVVERQLGKTLGGR